MPDANRNTLRLQAGHHRVGQSAGKQRVLAVVLNVASTQWAPLDIDAGTEHHVDALGKGFASERLADLADECGIPSRSQCDRGWEAGGGKASSYAEVVWVVVILYA